MSVPDKILTRVKNLLDMAKDASSPNEAAIAARRARSLMDKHQIEEGDLTDDTSTMKFGEHTVLRDTNQKWHSWMVVAIAELNDCIVKGTYGGYKYQGTKEDVELCAYMGDYIVSQCEYQYSVYSSLNGRAGGNAWKEGFSNVICGRLQEMKRERQTVGKGIMVVKAGLVEEHFGAPEYRESSSSPRTAEEVMAMIQGREAGQDMQFNEGITEDKTEKVNG